MPGDQSVIQTFDSLYNDAYFAWDPLFPLADRDLKFYLGDQWDEQEKRQLFDDGRSTFVFNRIRPVINFLTGYQRQRQNASVVVPVEGGDQLVADQMSKLMHHVMNHGEGYRYISDCFAGALKTGWNLLTIWMDYRSDPVDGDIRFSREPYNGFICDPYFTSLDWSDCHYLLRRKYLSYPHVRGMLPGKEKILEELYHNGWDRDDKFTWLPYQRNASGPTMMAYNEMYRQEWKEVDVVLDTESGDWRKWPGNKRDLKQFLDFFPDMQKVVMSEKVITKDIIVNDYPIEKIENPYDINEYMFVPFVAIFQPESDNWGLKIQSLTRCMIDPQREANRRRSQMVDIIDSQINSGWLADENSVINPRSLYQTSQGKVIWRREDAQPGAIEKIPPSQIPPGMFQLQELFDKDVKDISGVNDAAFGQMESANESGVLQMLKQGSAIANQQELMDNLRYSQMEASKKVIRLLQKWSPEKIERIIGEPPAENFYDPDLSKYDVEVTEGVLTSTQKQMYFRQLVEIQQLGAPVTGEMLARAAPIQGGSQYANEIQKVEQEQAQAAQAQQELQERVLQSQEEMNKAKAIGDIALSKERFTRAVANMGLEDERASAAIENRTEAVLNRVKSAKEIEGMDDQHLMNHLEMFAKLEEISRMKEAQTKQDDVNISANATAANQPERQPTGI